MRCGTYVPGTIMCLMLTAVWGKDINELVLQEFSIKGNLLVGIAHVNNALQSEGFSDEVMFVPVLPQIGIAPDMTNDVVLAKWLDTVRTTMEQSLCSPEPTWSVLRSRNRIDTKFIKIGEILKLLQAVHGCRITKKGRHILVYPFPEQLNVLCYSRGEKKPRSALGIVLSLYSPGSSHVFVHEDPMTSTLYILASDQIHSEALVEINSQGTLKTDLCIKGQLMKNKTGGTSCSGLP